MKYFIGQKQHAIIIASISESTKNDVALGVNDIKSQVEILIDPGI